MGRKKKVRDEETLGLEETRSDALPVDGLSEAMEPEPEEEPELKAPPKLVKQGLVPLDAYLAKSTVPQGVRLYLKNFNDGQSKTDGEWNALVKGLTERKV